MKINNKRFAELFDFVTDIKNNIAVEAYDEVLYAKEYADEWELIEDIINKILAVPEENLERRLKWMN